MYCTFYDRASTWTSLLELKRTQRSLTLWGSRVQRPHIRNAMSTIYFFIYYIYVHKSCTRWAQIGRSAPSVLYGQRLRMVWRAQRKHVLWISLGVSECTISNGTYSSPDAQPDTWYRFNIHTYVHICIYGACPGYLTMPGTLQTAERRRSLAQICAKCQENALPA